MFASTSLSIGRFETCEVQGDDEPTAKLPRLENETEEIENPDHKNEVFEAFKRLKLAEETCDFIIEIEGEEIHVHRLVLMASSRYYEAMLSHDTAEKKNGRVKMHGVELSAGKQCIDYMYTGKAKFSVKDPEKLIYAAELMQLQPLTDMYFEFLRKKVNAKNCLKYMQLAETFGRQSFADIFEKFSAENFSEVLESADDFNNFSLSLLEQCLKSVPDSGWRIEQSKWTAITTWMKNSEVKNPEEAFVKLFKTLRLENFSDDFLRDELLIEPLVDQSMECHRMIFNALLNTTRPRIDKAFRSGAAYIIACHSQSRMLQSFDVRFKEWKRFARIPVNVFKKPLDLIGVNGEVYLTSVDAISKFRDGKLIHLANTGLQPAYHQCIAHGNVIYMVSSEHVIKYNTRSNTWNVLSPKLGHGEGFFITSSNKHIYAMGGEGTRSNAKEFDFNTGTWEPIADMILGRKFGAAVWFNGKVYALGGEGNYYCNQTEFYSPDTNTWMNPSPDIKCTHYKCKGFTIGAKVYIIGGVRQGLFSYSAEKCSRCQITSVKNPVPSMALLDLKNSKSESIPSVQVDSGLACAVYIE